MSTLDLILTRYGIFMTVADVADLLKKSVNSLRVSLARNDELGSSLKLAMLKKGRKVYFESVKVAQILSTGDKCS